MYLINVIPLHRKIPDISLSYISKDNIKLGTIIDAPIKKSLEQSLVISIQNVKDEKSYIKSLPWKLISIQKNKDNVILQKKVIDTLFDFCSYSFVNPDVVIRACLKEFKVQKLKVKGNIETLTITSSNRKLKKLNNGQDYVSTLQNFISNFTINSPKINKISIDDAGGLSNYGILYLGFDPVAFIVLLARNLNIPISFINGGQRLRYQEWNLLQNKKQSLFLTNLRIISREDEDHIIKQYPIAKKIQEIILKNTLLGRKILILASAKNFAPKTICGDCGQIHICPNCKNHLKLVKNGRNYARIYGVSGEYIFVCANCNNGYTALTKCTNCDSWNLLPIGYGIERIIENLENLIPKKQHGDIYDFSTSVKQKKLKNWGNKGGIIIGGLNLINEIELCDICIVPSLGALLYNGFFESSERVRDILEYAQNCSQGMIVSVLKDNEKDFLDLTCTQWKKQELTDRKTLNYPPYARHLILTLDPYASRAEKIQNEIVKILEKFTDPNTGFAVAIEKDIFGQVKIHASFPNTHWSITNSDYSLPLKIKKSLLPFWKYLKVEVY
ncbi:hypothetical protein A2903_02985 [Candidatus Nomurabacteria bacterium RIFCSPLOWO2_01_FULL_33_17]|uniref:Primosomal protein N' 3' DNA-binding domain-containing protein n=1 Tax=Candidatus Nomurabacteria bacterium RIFCSPLOWO2_01_FULL_33_17 TaxID=1801764 RepID=A0A1F6WQ25_9BACT|nr:MAG: hypothetical protein A2903_02985 [Candidatus Nomurabacteria bacterium RIFCSPLOWO2_01_FULL_33_17]